MLIRLGLDDGDGLPPLTFAGLRYSLAAVVLWAAIEQAKADRVAEIDRERDVQIADRIREREDRDQKNRDRQIQSLWTTARQYSDVREYQKAADVLDQLLVIDAQNERARRFRDDCMYWAGMDQAINIRVNRNVETAKALKDTEKSATPWTDIYRYMDAREWADLTRRRAAMVASSQGDSEEANETRRRMSQKGLINGVDWSIHLNMTESTLENVLNFIREVARAKPREINIVPELPKTRSGKIMRRLLRDVVEGRELGDTTTLADASVVEEIRSRASESSAKEE